MVPKKSDREVSPTNLQELTDKIEARKEQKQQKRKAQKKKRAQKKRQQVTERFVAPLLLLLTILVSVAVMIFTR